MTDVSIEEIVYFAYLVELKQGNSFVPSSDRNSPIIQDVLIRNLCIGIKTAVFK